MCPQFLTTFWIQYIFWITRFSAQEDEDEPHPNLLRRTTIGNGLLCIPTACGLAITLLQSIFKPFLSCDAGPPESVFDWTREIDSDLSNQNINNQAFSRKHWRLLQCQDGLLHLFT